MASEANVNLREAAENALDFLENAPVSFESGVCCCGENMENHSSPVFCGHTPVDQGTYVVHGLIDQLRKALKEQQ